MHQNWYNIYINGGHIGFNYTHTSLNSIYGVIVLCFRCFDDNMYKQAMGIALETRRIDVFTDAIVKAVS